MFEHVLPCSESLALLTSCGQIAIQGLVWNLIQETPRSLPDRRSRIRIGNRSGTRAIQCVTDRSAANYCNYRLWFYSIIGYLWCCSSDVGKSNWEWLPEKRHAWRVSELNLIALLYQLSTSAGGTRSHWKPQLSERWKECTVCVIIIWVNHGKEYAKTSTSATPTAFQHQEVWKRLKFLCSNSWFRISKLVCSICKTIQHNLQRVHSVVIGVWYDSSAAFWR